MLLPSDTLAALTDRIHDDEVDTTEPVLRALVREHLPRWSGAPATPLAGTGTTNTLWRLRGEPADLIVRLPRMASGAASIETEVDLLPRLTKSPVAALAQVPRLVHAGTPTDAYPLPWMVVEWLDGDDLWARRDSQVSRSSELPAEMAALVTAIGSVTGVPAPDRGEGSRGGPLGPLLERLRRWLDDPRWSAAALVDVATIESLADEAAELVGETTPRRFVHGDLIPGNLLVNDDRLSAVIDWGGAGYGDPAQDLAPAWALFDGQQRQRFREAVTADDATWLRARAIELEHALGGVLYYVPRHHPLGDVMTRTLGHILDDAGRR